MHNRLLVLFFVICLAAAAAAWLPSPAAAAPAWQTPAPGGGETVPAARPGISLLGALVLLSPFAFLIWRAYREKTFPKNASRACLPVIDESQRPFAPVEDEPGEAKPR